MSRLTAVPALAFLSLLIFCPAHARQKAFPTKSQKPVGQKAVTAQSQEPVQRWIDKFGKGHTQAELNDILQLNVEYVESKGKSGAGGDLSGAHLVGANLSGAFLNGAQLNGADLTDANLIDAFLENTHLNGADLYNADLSGADFYSADLERVTFEPKSQPDLRQIATARNLELLTYNNSPDALFQLRKQFQDGGFRIQERRITYALKRKEAELSWNGCTSRKTGDRTRAILWSADSNLANCGSFVLNKVFFDWTSQYGMSPGRPLNLGVLLWLLCSLVYFACIRISGEAGLYRVYAENIEVAQSARRVERILPPAIARKPGVKRLLQFFWRESLVLRASMFFSLMNAFNIGFRDINFGRWLRLLTRQEFDIKATGWARVIAGWQSLISVFLIALWVLTYFGRPFE